VSGRIRSPRPAARIIAPISRRAAIRALRPDRRTIRELVDKRGERRELVVPCAGRAKVSHHAWHIVEVAGLAVAVIQARENAEHLQLALHAHPFEIPPECGEIGAHRQAALARALPIADSPVDLPLLVPRDIGIA
jgi:hypothetical protein